MLSERQIKDLLEHCKKVDSAYQKLEMCGDEGPKYFDYMINKGWIRALRMVLELNTVEEYDDDVEAKTVGTEDE